ncbi:hypothetical protein HMPREF0262_03733 [Clostridium sp. ATCC 29733]|nr:hypothetical protein HMPREF0262_03733 [Clostridium sp. ATCC 29733]
MFKGKSIRRTLAALLAGCLCLTAFAGCGDKKEGGTQAKRGATSRPPSSSRAASAPRAFRMWPLPAARRRPTSSGLS